MSNETDTQTAKLRDAAQNGNFDEVRRLVALGTDVNSLDGHGITPAMWAHFKGHKDIAKYLLAHGGNVNHDAFSECTLLMFAACEGDLDSVNHFLSIGAEVDLALPKGGETALHMAAASKHPESVKHLIRAGADVNRHTKVNAPTDMGVSDFTLWGETPLHFAAAYGVRETIQVLLDAGADKGMTNAKGERPLVYAEREKRPNDIIELLR